MTEDANSSLHLPTDHPFPAIAENEACDLINQWSAKGFFRLRNMGDKVFITDIIRGVAYTAHLQTQYERRTVRQSVTPYRGEALDDRGRAPAPWEIDVNQPRTFEERTDIVPIPHTDRVQICHQCHGQRQVTCSSCMGTGQIRCDFCGGRGIIQSQVMETARDASGNVVNVPRLIQRPCHCGNGRIVCTTCQGSRVLVCPTCTGTGALRTFDELVVRFQVAAQGELVDVTPVPDPWLAKRAGEVLVDSRQPQIDDVANLPEAARTKAKQLLDRSHDVDTREFRILLQHLRVERIPIHEVGYTYAGEEKKLWICGTDRAVHAPAAPWNRARMYALFAAIAIPVAGLLFWLATRLLLR